MVTVFESYSFTGKRRAIAERYYWKGMTKDVAEYCGTCLVCQRRNKMPKKTAAYCNETRKGYRQHQIRL